MQSHLRPNQTEFKPSFKNSPNSAEAAEESLANGKGAQLLYQPIKYYQFKPAKGGGEWIVCLQQSNPSHISFVTSPQVYFRKE